MNMKNKNFFGHPLTKQEAKQVMGGHVFPLSEFEDKCPLCDKPIEINTYSYYIICPYCGGSITIEKKNEE